MANTPSRTYLPEFWPEVQGAFERNAPGAYRVTYEGCTDDIHRISYTGGPTPDASDFVEVITAGMVAEAAFGGLLDQLCAERRIVLQVRGQVGTTIFGARHPMWV